MRTPAVVRHAIDQFEAPEGFEIVSAHERESSIMFDYGVRLRKELDGRFHFMWICLASETCRSELIPRHLSGGKTSAATKHLKQAHNLSSEKSTSEENRKRSRDDEISKLKSSDMYRDCPDRLNVLLETQRIINNNLPFRFGEYNESYIIRGVCSKEQLSSPVNAKMVRHAIVEMYSSAKMEIIAKIDEARIGSIPYVSIITDFWTCKITHSKYMGVRLSFVDRNWELTSVLLGIRQFNPTLEQRENGIRGPFSQWISQLLDDFTISQKDLFAATTDAGSDVKWMMVHGLKVKWQWCIPHMINAATKKSCGMVKTGSSSGNNLMSDLLQKIRDTIRQVKTVEVLGDHFRELCIAINGNDSSSILLDYQSHRFMGITKVMKRLIERWDVLTKWYETRNKLARNSRCEPPKFLLEPHKHDIIQLLSIFQPITVITEMAQSERPNQVEVLVSLFNLRLKTLDCDKPLKIYDNRRGQNEYHTSLTPLVINTRSLLAYTLHKNFYKRYEDPSVLRHTSYILEAQLILHPSYKNLDQSLRKIVQVCNSRKGVSSERVGNQMFDLIKSAATDIIKKTLASLIVSVDSSESEEKCLSDDEDSNPHTAYLLDTFGPNENLSRNIRVEQHSSRIQEELDRWLLHPAVLLGRKENGEKENVLDYWCRQYNTGTFTYLPHVAKILFSTPCSSASIERDFGISGSMVTSQRSSLKSTNIEMAMFLNRNKEFVDITQVRRMTPEQVIESIPRHITNSIRDQEQIQWEQAFEDCFSSQASIYDDDIQHA